MKRVNATETETGVLRNADVGSDPRLVGGHFSCTHFAVKFKRILPMY